MSRLRSNSGPQTSEAYVRMGSMSERKRRVRREKLEMRQDSARERRAWMPRVPAAVVATPLDW